MADNFFIWTACVISIILQPVTPINEKEEIIKSSTKLVLIKESVENVSRSWPNVTEIFLKLFVHEGETLSNICNNQEVLKTLLDQVELNKPNRSNVSNTLNEVKEDYTQNSNNREMPTSAQEISEILMEVFNKQSTLEAIFNVILESIEKTETAEFLQKQFDELKDFIKSQKVVDDETPQKLLLHDKHLNCLQNCDDKHQIYDSCESAMVSNFNQEGAYLIEIPNSGLAPFYAYCLENLNYIWMIVQRREDGSENFYRQWHDYKEGFGDVFGEYWIGLDRLHAITNSGRYKLLIMMENYTDHSFFELYHKFRIGDEQDGYRLMVDMYVGNSTNGFTNQQNMKFSTYDRDNDNSKTNCARFSKGAWWYGNSCGSHLNGRYFSYADSETSGGIVWGNQKRSLKRVYMAITKASDGDIFH